MQQVILTGVFCMFQMQNALAESPHASIAYGAALSSPALAPPATQLTLQAPSHPFFALHLNPCHHPVCGEQFDHIDELTTL
jgi:hypothetical protein